MVWYDMVWHGVHNLNFAFAFVGNESESGAAFGVHLIKGVWESYGQYALASR